MAKKTIRSFRFEEESLLVIFGLSKHIHISPSRVLNGIILHFKEIVDSIEFETEKELLYIKIFDTLFNRNVLIKSEDNGIRDQALDDFVTGISELEEFESIHSFLKRRCIEIQKSALESALTAEVESEKLEIEKRIKSNILID